MLFVACGWLDAGGNIHVRARAMPFLKWQAKVMVLQKPPITSLSLCNEKALRYGF